MDAQSNPCLIGKRVRIRAIKREGSARRLDGVIAKVIGPHPIAPGWYRIELEENNITPERNWTVPGDRLVLCAADQDEVAEAVLKPQSTGLRVDSTRGLIQPAQRPR
jgi:hypothetical protein